MKTQFSNRLPGGRKRYKGAPRPLALLLPPRNVPTSRLVEVNLPLPPGPAGEFTTIVILVVWRWSVEAGSVSRASLGARG